MIWRPKSLRQVAAPVDEQAAHWALSRIDKIDAIAPDAAFDHWLARDPGHADALADAETALAMLARHAGAPAIGVMRLRALEVASAPVRRHTARIAAAFVAAIAVSAAALLQFGQPHAEAQFASARTYTTAIGERATISLPDGSIATLDTNSAIAISYTRAERGIRLLRGQALFEVAKHRPLPFRVYAMDQRLTAVGTKFDVRIDHKTLKVAMLEGQISVTRLVNNVAVASDAGFRLTAGEALTTKGAGPMRVVARDTAADASWRDGAIVMRDLSLAEAVAEINRYTNNPVQISGDIGQVYHVSGVFQTHDPQHFAESMTDLFPLKFYYSATGRPVLSEK